ncbi:hypothetical protein CRP7_gp45 [Roseobacter phage CRP-7]|nr:hypothetical protein CRP7_gp45 [Roseobacter phage CRP-7]
MLELNYYTKQDCGQLNREGNWESTTHRQCSHCKHVFEKWGKTKYSLCKPCNTNRVLEQTPEVKMYRRAKSRARNKGLMFDLEKSDIFIPDLCPILGIPLICHKGSGAWPDSPSLDKVDPTLGYVKGNVWVISQRANQMKGSANSEELVAFANWVLKQ